MIRRFPLTQRRAGQGANMPVVKSVTILVITTLFICGCKSAPKKVDPPPVPKVEAPPPAIEAAPVVSAAPVEEGEEMIVAVIPELAFRTKPSRRGHIIDGLPYLTKVLVLDKTGPKGVSRGLAGRWYKIRYGGRTGFAFGAYLRGLDETHAFRLKKRRAIKIAAPKNSDNSAAYENFKMHRHKH